MKKYCKNCKFWDKDAYFGNYCEKQPRISQNKITGVINNSRIGKKYNLFNKNNNCEYFELPWYKRLFEWN